MPTFRPHSKNSSPIMALKFIYNKIYAAEFCISILMTILECLHQNPFAGGWSDWFAPDESVVLTFETMDHQLFEIWRTQCLFSEECNRQEGIKRPSGMIVDHSEFDPDEILAPGVHRDYHPDNPDLVDESYDIIIPNNRLSSTICEDWIDRLNKKYERCFELSYSNTQ